MQDHSNVTSPSVSTANDACPYTGIGTLFNPFSKEYLTDPYPFFAQARQTEPIFFSPVLNAWSVSRYDDINAAFHDPKHFSSVGFFHPVVHHTPASRPL